MNEFNRWLYLQEINGKSNLTYEDVTHYGIPARFDEGGLKQPYLVPHSSRVRQTDLMILGGLSALYSTYFLLFFKTRELDSQKDSFRFLGFEIGMKKSARTGKTYSHVEPSKKALGAIRQKIAYLTRREMTCVPFDAMMEKVNQTLQGWVEYFHYRNCSRALGKLKWQIKERMRMQLRKRHKIRHRVTGYVRFSRSKLYEQYGLYKVPATAGWTTAHSLR